MPESTKCLGLPLFEGVRGGWFTFGKKGQLGGLYLLYRLFDLLSKTGKQV